MTSIATKFIAKKVFKETSLGKYTGNVTEGAQEDPYFETVPATRLGIKTTKKRKRALPPGLTAQEEQVLSTVKRRAYRLDLSLFSLCGLRFGWSSVIGIIPAIGDVADMLFALMIFRTACSVEPPLPASVKAKMQMNIVIDFVIGIIPFLGDLADAAFKCNTKNAILLETELRERGKKRLRQSGQPIPTDYSEVDQFETEEADARRVHGQPPAYNEPVQQNLRQDRRRDDIEQQRVEPPRQQRRF